MRRLYGDLESNSVYREMRATNMPKAAKGDYNVKFFE
jgi:hypothetical protein